MSPPKVPIVTKESLHHLFKAVMALLSHPLSKIAILRLYFMCYIKPVANNEKRMLVLHIDCWK